MDTSASTSSLLGQNAAQSAAQRKFYQWVLKWINGMQYSCNDSTGEEPHELRGPTKPDVPTLACFFQALGFKLLSFEKQTDTIGEKGESKKLCPGSLTISIECGTSNMRAILELGEVMCQCPNPDHVKDASFWSISGTGPMGSVDNIAQKVEETGSNLLPHISKEVTRVLRDVSNRLFEIIACEPDVNRNTDVDLNSSRIGNASYERRTTQEVQKPEMGVTRSHTQPEIRLRSDSLTSKSFCENRGRSTNSESSGSRNVSPAHRNKPPFQRQRTWDIDIDTASLDEEPRPSPPKITSSPAMMAELSNSLGQISLKSEIQNPKDITDYILGAQQNLEKALKMLLVKKSTMSNETTPNKDQDVESVKSAPAFISPYKPVGSYSTHGIKPLSKLSYSTHEQTLLTKLSTTSNNPISKARRSIEPTMTKSMTRRSMQLEPGHSKLPTHRRSFGIPLSASSSNSSIISKLNMDEAQKTMSNVECNSVKINSIGGSDTLNRPYITAKKRGSPEPQQTGVSPAPKSISTPNARASMLKPPTKISISKTLPVKIKTAQPSRLSTGIAAKPRNTLSRE